MNRSPQEKIDEVVKEASGNLQGALTRSSVAEQCRLWLLVAGRPVRSADKIAAFRAARLGLWGALEKSGLAIPNGPRSEIEVSYEGGSEGLWGSVQVPLGDLSLALEITRRENAICLAADMLVHDPLASVIAIQSQLAVDKASSLLLLAVRMLDDVAFAARGFGEFDDTAVGVEVFAVDVILDMLETSLETQGESGGGNAT
jgi:hypothetical protein